MATLKNFIAFLLALLLVAPCFVIPALAYADDDPTTRFNYNKDDFDRTKPLANRNYGQGMFYSKQNDRYVNSYQEYYINFDDPYKQSKVGHYTPPSNGYEYSAVLTSSLAVAATFGGPIGSAVSIGFSFISSAIQKQEEAVIQAYGSDYAFTDWLIDIFDKQEAHKILYDRSFTIVTNYKSKVEEASKDTIKAYEEKNGEGTWATDKIGLKAGEFGVDAGLARVAGHVGAGTATPLADAEEMMFPPTSWDSIVEETVKSKIDEASGDGEYSKDSILKKTKPQPEGKDRQLVYIEEKGYMVVIHPLTDEEIATIQQLIYYLCSSRDWRMMIAEARNIGNEISSADFSYSIQYMMGLSLSPFFDMAKGLGFANLGHYLDPINPDALQYGADYIKQYYQSLLGPGFEDMTKDDAMNFINQLIVEAKRSDLGDDVVAQLEDIYRRLRSGDSSVYNTLGGGNVYVAKAIQVVSKKVGTSFTANEILPSLGSNLARSNSATLQNLGASLGDVKYTKNIISNVTRGASVADMLVYIGLHDDMVQSADSAHRIAIGYAQIVDSSDTNSRNNNNLSTSNSNVRAYVNIARAEGARQQIADGNTWGTSETTYWGIY